MSSTAMSGRKPPLKKKNKSSIKLTSNPSLPDDLLLSCFARISKLYYPTLSLVSKRFRSLLASRELYQIRSLLGRTESCLYVCLQLPREDNFRWYTLYRRHKKKKKKNILVPVPSNHSPRSLNVVAIGSSIYSIGGCIDSEPSSNVSVLDCWTNTWHQAPNMQVAKKYLAANVIDGKIYVIGRREHYHSSSRIEVFDPKTQIWNSLSTPGHEICSFEKIYSTEIDGKICMYGGHKGVAYNPKDGTFEPLKWDMCIGWVRYSHCVIDNVLFCYYNERVLKWFDTKARLWRNLEGSQGILIGKIARNSDVKLADYGGKIAVLWDMNMPFSGFPKKAIWCMVIAVERRNSEEIWGNFEWQGVVLTLPTSCKLVCVLATML